MGHLEEFAKKIGVYNPINGSWIQAISEATIPGGATGPQGPTGPSGGGGGATVSLTFDVRYHTPNDITNVNNVNGMVNGVVLTDATAPSIPFLSSDSDLYIYVDLNRGSYVDETVQLTFNDPDSQFQNLATYSVAVGDSSFCIKAQVVSLPTDGAYTLGLISTTTGGTSSRDINVYLEA